MDFGPFGGFWPKLFSGNGLRFFSWGMRKNGFGGGGVGRGAGGG